MKIPIFFGSKGHWGQHGMVKISFWKWLTLRREHVTKIKWVKCKVEVTNTVTPLVGNGQLHHIVQEEQSHEQTRRNFRL